LQQAGILAAAIHSNKSQNVRQRVLAQFKSPRPPVLVATDIAARGLDVDDISHVINYDLPEIPEIYVHRIGRTGRAGAAGRAVSFCGHEERPRLRRIERLTRRTIEIEKRHAPL
jgi:ATP-dependent RNA helicase RhlE